jgi:hypothetical protein
MPYLIASKRKNLPRTAGTPAVLYFRIVQICHKFPPLSVTVIYAQTLKPTLILLKKAELCVVRRGKMLIYISKLRFCRSSRLDFDHFEENLILFHQNLLRLWRRCR